MWAVQGGGARVVGVGWGLFGVVVVVGRVGGGSSGGWARVGGRRWGVGAVRVVGPGRWGGGRSGGWSTEVGGGVGAVRVVGPGGWGVGWGLFGWLGLGGGGWGQSPLRLAS